MSEYDDLAELIFPDVVETIDDLEKRYPERVLPEGAIVSRFAPSPTGFLHTGSLFSAFIVWKFTHQTKGVFYIRLEDTDTKREIEGSGADLLKQLDAFGIVPDEGYLGDHESGQYGPYIQSHRAQIYRTVIKEMVRRNLAYPCFCTPQDLDELRSYQEANKLNPGYYGEYAKCAKLTVQEAMDKIKVGTPYVMRFRSHGCYKNRIEIKDLIRGKLQFAQNDQDIVILKSDGLPTYHFAHLCDDHFMRSTHIIRGEEWLASLPIHFDLFTSMHWKMPKYAHLPVIMKLDNGNRRKLSKRKDPEAAVSYFLQEGYPQEGFLEYLITIANSNFEEWRLQNKCANMLDFNLDFKKMTLDGALFDIAKVKNICKERLSRMTKEEFTDKAYHYACQYNPELKALIDRDRDYFMSIINIEREKDKPRKDFETYKDIVPTINFFYDDYYDELKKEVVLPWNETISKDVIAAFLKDYSNNLGLDLTEEEWLENVKTISSKYGFCPNMKEYKQNKDAYVGSIGDATELIRIAYSTRKNTANPYCVMKIIGQERVQKRINKTVEELLIK
jgi:glutamyl-tRNA synthetase